MCLVEEFLFQLIVLKNITYNQLKRQTTSEFKTGLENLVLLGLKLFNRILI